MVTLMRHCAGSSAAPIVAASQLGWRAAIAKVHMRTLVPEKVGGRLQVSLRSRRRGDKSEEDSFGGMGKSPQQWI